MREEIIKAGKIITEKISSGKFIFTMVAAFVFAVLSLKGIMPVDKVHDIILIVLYAYFTRKPNEVTK